MTFLFLYEINVEQFLCSTIYILFCYRVPSYWHFSNTVLQLDPEEHSQVSKRFVRSNLEGNILVHEYVFYKKLKIPESLTRHDKHF